MCVFVTSMVFCKFKDECKRKHIDNICEDFSCEGLKCMSRHPKLCKFYNLYGRCKFNPCAYLHPEKDKSIDDMKKENEIILENIKKTENAIEEINAKLASHENLDDKLNVVENKLDIFNRMEREYYEKGEAIETLNAKVKEMGKKLI